MRQLCYVTSSVPMTPRFVVDMEEHLRWETIFLATSPDWTLKFLTLRNWTKSDSIIWLQRFRLIHSISSTSNIYIYIYRYSGYIWKLLLEILLAYLFYTCENNYSNLFNITCCYTLLSFSLLLYLNKLAKLPAFILALSLGTFIYVVLPFKNAVLWRHRALFYFIWTVKCFTANVDLNL